MLHKLWHLQIAAWVGLGLFGGVSAHAQAPSIAWRTNVNATLFGVDSQTNVYANANGSVITLNSLGVPVATNSYCPVQSIAPEFAQRDSAGNFYFAGNFDGTNDFGGKIIVGGWTNNTPSGNWQPGYPTCYLAKYGPGGTLLWATSFGKQASTNAVTDLVMNPDNSVTAGVDQGPISAQVTQFSSTGSNLWETTVGSFWSGGLVRLSGLHGTNGAFLIYIGLDYGLPRIGRGYYTSSGAVVPYSPTPLTCSSSLSVNSKPVTILANEIYVAGLTSPGQQPVLEKDVLGGGILWTQAISSVEQWILNDDGGGNLYLSGTNGSFSKYNSAGMQIWTTNYTSPAVIGLADSSGDHLVQFADNTIALMSSDPGSTAPTAHLSRKAGDGASATGFQFSLAGSPGCVYEAFWSTNLTSWQSMGYVTNNSGDIQIVDPDATNHLQKFYRFSP